MDAQGLDWVRGSLRPTAAAAFWNLRRRLPTSHGKPTKRLVHGEENHRWSHRRTEDKGANQTRALEVAWEPGAWWSLRLDQHRKLYLLLPQTDLPTGHLPSRSLSMDARQLLPPLPRGARWLQSVPASRGPTDSPALDSACIVFLPGFARVKSPLPTPFSYRGHTLDLGCLGHLEYSHPKTFVASYLQFAPIRLH